MKNRITDQLASKPDSRRLTAETDEDNSNNVLEFTKHQFVNARQAAEKVISTHPLICLSAAVAAGITLGWWVKRR